MVGQLPMFQEPEFQPGVEVKSQESKYQRWKRLHQYKKSNEIDKKCKKCANERTFEVNDKLYHKYSLLGYSRGPATDIRVSFLCDLFKLDTNET